MRRLLVVLGIVLGIGVPVALGARVSSADGPFSPVGLNQKIVVVACFYNGDTAKDTDITARTWARVLNDKLNAYYLEATGGKVSFKFIPVLKDCEFKETYAETKPAELPGASFSLEDDPATVFREGGEAIPFADSQLGNHPWAGIAINRLLVIVNRPKRGRATLPPGIFANTGSSGPKNITVSVVAPKRDKRAQMPLASGSGRRGDFEGVVDEEDIALIAHELGHQLGLPDLYNDAANGEEFTGFWDQMAFDNLENFSAFSRYLARWLSTSEYRVVTPGTPPGGVEVTINPPLAGGTEAVLLPTGGPLVPSPPGSQYNAMFQGYILEARSHTGLDKARRSKYADGGDANLTKYCSSMGTPGFYTDGVLVSAVSGDPDARPAGNPLAVIPALRSGEAVGCKDDGSFKFAPLSSATYSPGRPFSVSSLGLQVTVLSRTDNGGWKVKISYSGPPTPNVVPTDLWLDSTANGYDTFWIPDNDHDGAPDLFGDPVYTPVSVTLSLTAPPQITYSTTTHRLSLRVQNSGDAVASDVRGTVYILGGEIPVAADFNADTLGRSSVSRPIDVSFGDVEPGAFATKTVEVTPAGPFVAALLLAPNGTETATLDNLRIEPFLAVQTGSGSPYKPIVLALPLSNANRKGAALYASPYPLPTGWQGTLDAASKPGRSHALLRAGAKETFRLQLQPPDPAVAKPGQVKQITITGFMSEGDTYVPEVQIPVDVVLSRGTALTLTAKGTSGKTSLEGALTYRDGGRDRPLARTAVRIAVSALGRGEPARRAIAVMTRANGTFAATVETKKGARYGAVAEYGGSLMYQTARSVAVAFATTTGAPATNKAPAAKPATTSAATTTAPAPVANTPKAYGVADDTGKFADDGGKAFYASLKAGALSLNRWTLVWNGSSTPDRDPFLDRAVPAAGAAGIGIILALFPNPTSPPLPLQAGFADDFCKWAASVARNYPQIRRFIIGNEVNAARFWPQGNGGVGVYYETLKTCYDRLKAVSGGIQVIGLGLAPRAVSRPASTPPLDFIKAMGAAYRAEARALPIMDALAVHPYPNPNAKPQPTPAKGGYEDPGFFGVTQLDRVKAALESAFAGTAQPTTANGLRLVVDEYGYQTDTAGDGRYSGDEKSPVVSEAEQAAYYADAITRILACDPAVSDVLLFLLVDEAARNPSASAGGWQSGLQHPDGSPKPSFDAVAAAVKTGCSG